MEGRTGQFVLWSLSLGLSAGLMGCVPWTPKTEITPSGVLPTVPPGGWLISQLAGLTAYDAQGQVVGEQPVLEGQTVQGVLLRPATREPIVILTAGDTWIVSLLQQGTWTPVYSSKVKLTSCDVAPNGHALLCIQAGDLNLIRFSDQHAQRLDSGVLEATWSPTNTDVLVSYADHTDLLGLNLDDQVATRTVLVSELVSGGQFVNSHQLVWWTGDETARQLQLYNLRAQEQTTLWTGAAVPVVWVESTGNRLALSDNRSCDPSCTTTILSLPQGTVLQTVSGIVPMGWAGSGLVTAAHLEPIDQDLLQGYHFATLSSDHVASDLGDGLFIATDQQLHMSLSH